MAVPATLSLYWAMQVQGSGGEPGTRAAGAGPGSLGASGDATAAESTGEAGADRRLAAREGRRILAQQGRTVPDDVHDRIVL